MAHGLPVGAVGLVPVVQGRAAHGLEQIPPRLARERAHGDGREGRAEGGRARLRDRLAQRVRQDRQTVDVGQLALIGRHAERGVALGVLDALEPLAGGQLDVGHLHVVLEVEERLLPDRVRRARRHQPDGGYRVLALFLNLGRVERGGLEPEPPARLRCGLAARTERVARAPPARRRPGREGDGAPVGARGRACRIGQERRPALVPDELAAGLGPQMHRGRPAARHRHRVAGDALAPLARAGLVEDAHALDAPAAQRRHAGARDHAQARRARARHQRAVGVRPRVHDGGDGEPRLGQGQRGAVGVVVVGDDHGALGRHGLVGEEVAHGRGQHHAGQVVGGEGHGPLDRAGRRQHLPRAHPPQPVAWPALPRRALVHQGVAVVEHARQRRPRPQDDVRHGAQAGHGALDPLLGGPAVDRRAVHRRPPAPMRRLLREDHARPGPARDQGRPEARDAAARDQQVRVGVDLLVAVGVGLGRRATEAGGAADQRLVDVGPERAGPKEGLVVEARRQELRQGGVHRAHVALQARPAVLRGGDEAVVQLGRGGARVGLVPRPLAEVHERVGLLGPRRHDAARAVVLERSPDQRAPGAQEGRGQRVAGITLVGPPVEGEAAGPPAVEAPTARGKPDHASRLQPGQSGRRAPTAARTSAGGSLTAAG